ncbi:hypothetical protein LJC64_05325 [Ruminococcaceae bacterium OttesenSCG-928-A11]|nr:hypothetical protein [Ruminococcaceae bacterium OttesenSCG-928-A11]
MSSERKSNRIKILNGPTLNGLKTAFCNAYGENDASTRFELDMHDEENDKNMLISFKLIGLSYDELRDPDDGHRLAGFCFVFKGVITNAGSWDFFDEWECVVLNGFYNTKTRKGYLDFPKH